MISPDLTTNDKSKQQSSGGEIVVDNTAAEFHCTILAIAPSPIDPNLIWVGTDDGNVQLTRDGGRNWTNVVKNMQGLAPNAWIPTVEASHFDAGTAYVAADHHQDNDYQPFFFKTTDFGRTWTRITGGLPPKGWAHVIREDPKNRNLLYAGTEFGVYASWDAGSRWVPIRGNIPPVAVYDIQIHPRDNDVIVATHGRGIYTLDDATALQQIQTALKSDSYLFPIRPAIRWAGGGGGGFRMNERDWLAPNPPAGAYINVYVKTPPREPLTVIITDRAGKTVRTLAGLRAMPGVNRFVWNLRADNPNEQQGQPGGGRGGQTAGQQAQGAVPPAMLERFGGAGGPFVLPGDYTVKVKVGSAEYAQPVTVKLDPRVQASAADMAAQVDAANQLSALTGRVNAIIARVDDLVSQLTALDQVAARQRPVPAWRAEVKAATDALKTLRDSELARPLPGLGYRQYPRLRENVQSLAGSVQRGFRPPSEGEKLRMMELTDQTKQAAAKLNAIISNQIAKVNQATKALPHIVAEPIR